MRLRAQKPSLFGNHPIPSRDVDIRRNEALMVILAQEVSTGLEIIMI